MSKSNAYKKHEQAIIILKGYLKEKEHIGLVESSSCNAPDPHAFKHWKLNTIMAVFHAPIKVARQVIKPGVEHIDSHFKVKEGAGYDDNWFYIHWILEK